MDLPTIVKGTKEWDKAVINIANGGNTSYRTRTATETKELLNEARGNMNRYKNGAIYEIDKDGNEAMVEYWNGKKVCSG